MIVYPDHALAHLSTGRIELPRVGVGSVVDHVVEERERARLLQLLIAHLHDLLSVVPYLREPVVNVIHGGNQVRLLFAQLCCAASRLEQSIQVTDNMRHIAGRVLVGAVYIHQPDAGEAIIDKRRGPWR